MKKIIKLLSLAVVFSLVLSFTVCGCDKNPAGKSGESSVKQEVVDISTVNADNAKVRMSVLYNELATRMKYDSTYTPYSSIPDGTRYQNGAWKPTWKELQDRLKFSITDVTPEKAQSMSNAFDLLQANKFATVDIVSGPVSSIVEEGTKNNRFTDLTQYKEYLPDFFKFINENEIVKASITSDNGAIYYAPYFDGFDDVETMFICRVDWVQKLLDDEITVFSKDSNGVETSSTQANSPTYDEGRTLAANKNTTYYNGYYDSMDTSFEALKSDGTKQTVSVKYNSGEGIIALQNALATKNGKSLTETLKTYINKYYVTPGYISKPSELFCGQNACYNADELIALWRCVYTNPALLNGSANADIVPFYPRARTADRANQVLQLCQIWGVRGYESRNGYFYLDENGKLQDSRTSDDMMESLELLNQIYNEGLILHDYMKDVRTQEHREYYNTQNLGFMTYDYNQTTSIFNETINDSQTPYRNISPILYPVADWDNKATAVDGKSGQYNMTTNDLYQYTESWRSVKGEGWAINFETAKTNPAAFKKALEVFNYMYTKEGQTLMTFGPDAYIATNTDGSLQTITYKGRQVPKIKPETLAELKDRDKGKGNYTNYYRYYVGATLPLGFVKEQGMEYQTVDKKGLAGLDIINKAAEMGTLKHASVVRDNAKIQNSLVPTTFALSRTQNETANNTTADLAKNFNNSSADGQNVFHSYVMNGFNNGNITISREALVTKIKDEWKLNSYLRIHQNAYDKMYGLK